jgi:pimeloyl-ACP methyl ester carboxylesterase
MNVRATEGAYVRPLVISLHGIRTRGSWQKDLAVRLNRAGFDYCPLDFGFFRAVQLVWPSSRDRHVEWFRDVYTRAVRESSGAPVSVVAHSFGTYLVARAIEKFPELTFDRIVMCGSIVRRDYPWTRVINETVQVHKVLNDYGRMDFWAGIVRWVVSDAGPSGTQGFIDDAQGQVLQQGHLEFRHSDYFYELHFDQLWIPFLSGFDLGAPPPVDIPATNWRFRLTVAIVALLACALVFGAARVLPRLLTQMTSRSFCNTYQSSYVELPVPPRKKLTETQRTAATTNRICINSYPWPKGKYLDSVTAPEMNSIRIEANRRFDPLVAQQVAFGNRDDTHDSLLRPYGDLLYMLVLKREKRFDEMIRHYTEANTIQALSREDFAMSDDAEEATYFSRDSLNKLITLLFYQALANSKSVSPAQVHHALDEYVRHRASFVFQLGVVGDPYFELVSALGCKVQQ